MKIKFWGVRGSIPTPGPNTVKYGGNTSCITIEIENIPDHFIILDAGSGVRNFGIDVIKNRQFLNEKFFPLHFHIFFSHVHWDHIQGIPFFKPMFIKGNKINMYGERKVQFSLEQTLIVQQQYPNFPISLEEVETTGAEISFKDLLPKGSISLFDKINVSWVGLSHPDGVLCYRIDYNDKESSKSVVYATDTEHRNIIDPRLIGIAQGADILIYDAQYTPSEYSGEKTGMSKFGWGHSTYEFAVDTALKVGVKQLYMFHHDPEHSDKDIDSIVALARIRAYITHKKSADDLLIDAAAEGTEILI